MDILFPTLHWTNLLVIPGLLIGYTIHELAHAFVAYLLGDYSQVERGKITLNPFRHVSWFGSFAFILFGIGWPNPLKTNPQNFKQKHLAMCLIAISGPVASFTFGLVTLLFSLSIVAGLVYITGTTTDRVFPFVFQNIFPFLFPISQDLPETLNLQTWSIAFNGYIAATSLWLAIISLLPLPGLDGFIFIFSLIAYFRERKQGPETRLSNSTSNEFRPLINLYKRRNNVSDIHFKLGVEYHEAQKYDDAIARYRQALNTDQHFGPAYVNLGLAYLAKGKRREAIHAFRGAVQYADDQKSQGEAWYQLHQLSEVSPVNEEAAQASMAKMGSSPWTDTKPRPNWIGLSLGSAFLVIIGVFLYSHLITSLIEMLKA
jgi:Zn-dependent protease